MSKELNVSDCSANMSFTGNAYQHGWGWKKTVHCAKQMWQ